MNVKYVIENWETWVPCNFSLLLLKYKCAMQTFGEESDFADFIFPNVALNLFPNVALNLYDFAQSPLGAVWEGGCYHYGNCHRQ